MRKLQHPEVRARLDDLEQARLERDRREAEARVEYERQLAEERAAHPTFEVRDGIAGDIVFHGTISAEDWWSSSPDLFRPPMAEEELDPLEAKRRREQQYVGQFSELWRGKGRPR